eukprot:scaffold746_cov123-Cylindrotheca_fusiformis.AAC.2
MEGCYEQGRTSSRSSPDGGFEGAIMAVVEGAGSCHVDAVMKEPETTPSTTTASSCSGSESHAPAIPTQPSPQATTKKSKDIKLAIAFVLMVLVATGLSVMGKLVVRSLTSSSNAFSSFSLSNPAMLHQNQQTGNSLVQLSEFFEFVQFVDLCHSMFCLHIFRAFFRYHR